ncbi:MAG: c-type cytochrome [Hyphomicrobiales bacterium]
MRLLAATISLFCAFTAQVNADSTLLKADNAQVVAKGKEVYANNCASCHGDNLEGQPNWRRPEEDGTFRAPPHDHTGHTWRHTDDILFGITKYGTARFGNLKDFKSTMPVFENVLNDVKIIAALSFIKAQWPEEIVLRHNDKNIENENPLTLNE